MAVGRKKIILRFIQLFVGLFAGLLIGEITCRAIYTKPWYDSLVEEQALGSEHASAMVNKWGLRDRDYATPKPANTKRILILGESFTYGWGVADDSLVYPRLLEKQLNPEYISRGLNIEILNGGIPGSLTKDWVDLLQKVKDEYDPDVILVIFFLRDGTRLASIGAFFDPIRAEIVTQNQKSWLYQNLYIYRLSKDTQDRFYVSDRYTKALSESYFGDEKQTEEWKLAQSNLLQIKKIADERHIKTGFVVYPVLVQLDDSYPFAQVEKLVVNYGKSLGFPTFDLFPAFKGKNGPSLWVSSYDQHPNETAHGIVANAILPFVKQLLTDN